MKATMSREMKTQERGNRGKKEERINKRKLKKMKVDIDGEMNGAQTENETTMRQGGQLEQGQVKKKKKQREL